MLILRLERIDGEYVLRIPKHDIATLDLRDGQLLAVSVEPIDDFNTIGVETTDRPAESWKLNEPGLKYDEGR